MENKRFEGDPSLEENGGAAAETVGIKISILEAKLTSEQSEHPEIRRLLEELYALQALETQIKQHAG